jgi:hypothetical protein
MGMTMTAAFFWLSVIVANVPRIVSVILGVFAFVLL